MNHRWFPNEFSRKLMQYGYDPRPIRLEPREQPLRKAAWLWIHASDEGRFVVIAENEDGSLDQDSVEDVLHSL